MKKSEYQKLYELEKTYWWFVGRRMVIKQIIKNFLGRTKHLNILDYGSGSGGNLPLLEEFGTVVGAENSDLAIELSKQKLSCEIYKIEDKKPLPFIQSSFDLITLLDVLEHIENDQEFLKNLKSYLKRGGFLLITVPAYKFLWSEHDEALGHFRRYTASELVKKLGSANLVPIHYTYTISFLLPAIIGYRFLKKMFRLVSYKNRQPQTSYIALPAIINYVFIFLLKIESILLTYFKIPFGASILILAKREK